MGEEDDAEREDQSQSYLGEDFPATEDQFAGFGVNAEEAEELQVFLISVHGGFCMCVWGGSDEEEEEINGAK